MIDAKIAPLDDGSGSWDLVIGEDGDIVMVGGDTDTHVQAVLQRVAFALLTWLGESPFDRSSGFPWEESVFGRQPLEGIAALVQDRILAVDGVDGIETVPELVMDKTARVLSITARVRVGDYVAPIAVEVSGD